MNSIDIVCLVLIIFFMLIGIWHGFLRGIFRLLAWAAAIAGAYFANNLLSDTISSTLQTSTFSTPFCTYSPLAESSKKPATMQSPTQPIKAR